MVIALIISGLAIQAGGALIGIGAKIAYPEICKVLGTANIDEISNRINDIDKERAKSIALEVIRKTRLKSKVNGK